MPFQARKSCISIFIDSTQINNNCERLKARHDIQSWWKYLVQFHFYSLRPHNPFTVSDSPLAFYHHPWYPFSLQISSPTTIAPSPTVRAVILFGTHRVHAPTPAS